MTRLDARGERCPLPTVRAALALEALPPGGVLELLADDPVTRRDLPAWCAEFGHTLLGIDDADGFFTLRIQKK